MNLTEVGSFADLFKWADAIADGWLSISLVVGVFMTSYVLGMRFGKTKALIFSGFLTSLISFFLTQFGVLDWVWVVVSGVAMLIGIILDSFYEG